MQTIPECPVCGGDRFSKFLRCRDFSVSHETFTLMRCHSCSFILTSPRPDHGDIDKYYHSENYISHSTTTNNLFDRAYKITRVFTLKWKLNTIRAYSAPRSRTLLDYGSGTGEFLQQAQRKGLAVEGVEPSLKARTFARQLTGATINEKLGPEEQKYDIITLWHVLEHIPNLSEQFTQLKTALAKDGTMFIAVPNHQSHDARHYGGAWAAYDVPRHLWHFQQESMTRFLTKHALTLKAVLPMKLDALYVSMLSEQYLAGKKNPATMVKGLRHGFLSNHSARTTKEYSSLIYVATKS